MNLIDAKAKILLADDDDEVLAALSSVLTSEGYEVIVAKNGREAIEQFLEQHIDVALLDLNMPVKGGWEAFERLTTIHPLLQVIVITARPDQYPLAIAAGVAALMEKPLDLPLLLQTIDDLLVEQLENRLSRLAGRRPITRYLDTAI
jgi:CheY-like chemotaxis protein